MTTIYFVLALIFVIFSLGWLLLVIAGLRREWQTVPSVGSGTRRRNRYVALWRLIPPIQLLSLFAPQLIEPGLGFRNIWFLFGYLTFIVLIFVPYYFGRREEHRRRDLTRHQVIDSVPIVGSISLRIADRAEDYNGAGAIFAQVFGYTLDQVFGHDRAKNGLLLGELLQLRPGELHVAVDECQRVVGAMWLDLGDPAIKPLRFRQIWPILKRYLDRFNAFYGAVVGVPAMMAKQGSKKLAYIQWLGVLPSAQGKGIGTRLLDVAQTLARAEGKQVLSLHTESSNKAARRLYRRYGMQEQPHLPAWPQVAYKLKLDS